MATTQLGTFGIDAIANTGSFVTDVNKAADATEKFGRTAKTQKVDLDKLVASIDPVAAAYGRLDKLQLELNKNAQALDRETFEGLTAKIAAQRGALEKSETQMKGNAKTARELSFALRNLPAQFTDIVVSLQAGQAPLTVLLQQGGQLKDMFGGVGPAIKVMGEYLLGLATNPIVILAATVGTLVAGFKIANEEVNAFNKAIITTGNQAGVTASELHAMAASVDQVVGTQRKASEVLAQLVSTGKIAADQLEAVTMATVRFSAQTGDSIDNIVARYVSLAEDPVAAIVKLNEAHGFLTAEVYKEIFALAEQGRTAEAAALGIELLNDANNKMAADLEKNKGKFSRFFSSVKEFGAESIDWLAGIDRPVDELETLTNKLAKLDRSRAYILKNYSESGREAFLEEERLTRLALEALLEQQAPAREAARQQAENNQLVMDGVEAHQSLTAKLKENRSDAEKLEDAYSTLGREIAAAADAGFTFDPEQIEALYAAAEEKFTPAIKRADDAAKNLLSTLREQEDVLVAQQDQTDKLSANNQALIRFEGQIARLKQEGATAETNSLLAQEEAIRSQYQLNISLENGLAYLRKEAAAQQAENNRVVMEGAAAHQKLNGLLKETWSDAEKLADAYSTLERELAAAAEAGFAFSPEQIEALYAATKDKFTPAIKGADDAARNLLATLREQEDILVAQQDQTDKLSANSQALIKFEGQIVRLKQEGATSETNSLLAQEDEIRNQYRLNIGLENRLASLRQIEDSYNSADKIYESLLTREERSLTITRERLAVLEEAKKHGYDRLKYETALARITQGAFTAAPSVAQFERSDEDSGQARISRARDELEQWYSEQLSALDNFRANEAEYMAQWDARALELQQEYMRASATLDDAMFDEKGKKFEEFAKQAAKNMQDAFAEFLFDPFDGGLEGMVKNFATAMRKIAAEQASASTLKWFSESEFGSSIKGSMKGLFDSAASKFITNTGLGDIKTSLETIGTVNEDGTSAFDKDGLTSGLKELGLTIAASYAGGELGSALGKGLSGKQAESNIGQTIGTAVGSWFGPWGALAGSALGSFVDVIGGGDGYKRQNAGFLIGGIEDSPGAKAKYKFDVENFASGLEVTGFARREDPAAAKQVIETFRSIDSLLVEAVKLLDGDLTVKTIRGVDEEATTGTVGTFLGLGRDSNLNDQIDLFVTQLADNITGLDESLLKMIQSADTAEGVIQALNDALRIREIEKLIEDLDGVQAAKDQFNAQTGLVAAYDNASASIRNLMVGFQGTVEQTDALSLAIIGQQEAVFNLTMAYLETQQAVDLLFGGLSENIRKSLMDREELYNYERDQVRALTSMLDTLTDPEAIYQTAQEIERRVAGLWASLDDPDSRDAMGDEYLQYLAEVQEIAQRQLAEGLAAAESEQENINEMLISGIRGVVDYFMTGSQISLQAAQLSMQAARTLAGGSSANSEVR